MCLVSVKIIVGVSLVFVSCLSKDCYVSVPVKTVVYVSVSVKTVVSYVYAMCIFL